MTSVQVSKLGRKPGPGGVDIDHRSVDWVVWSRWMDKVYKMTVKCYVKGGDDHATVYVSIRPIIVNTGGQDRG